MPPEHFRVPACMYSEAIAENANARSPGDVNCWVRPYRLRRPRRQDSCRCAAGRDGHLPRRSTGRTVEWRLPLLGPREFLAKGKKAPSTKERTPRRVDAVDMPAAAMRAALVQDGRTAGKLPLLVAQDRSRRADGRWASGKLALPPAGEFTACSSKLSCPLAYPFRGSPIGLHRPRSHTMTDSPFGIVPSKSP
jgi:hypothetical protein